MEGIFIPKEILKIQELTSTEKMVLSLYKYYTEKGTNKCYSLTKPQIADELNISTRYMKKIKSHLIDLGYIRTYGKIKVVYLGVQGDTRVSSNDVQGDTIVPPGGHQSVQGGTPECPVKDTIVSSKGTPECPVKDTIVSSKGTPECPHKEEKKELKEEIKEEEKIAFANLKLIVDRLYPTYKTPDKVKFLWDKFKDRLSNIDLSESGAVDNWVVGFQNTLLKEYPTEQVKQVTPQPKTKSDTIDMF